MKEQVKNQDRTNDRNCILYGFCARNHLNNTAHKISKFGLMILQQQR
jgi:hypothetical protein